MQASISELLTSRFNKNVFIQYLIDNPTRIEETMELSLQSIPKVSWRAAWALNHLLKKTDPRTQSYIESIISCTLAKEDGHQRELLKILESSVVPENLEGKLFNICVTIWEDISKSPSVRMVAFRLILKIVKSFPELMNEIEFLTQDHYLESLSPGIKRSLIRQLNKTRVSI